MESINFIAALLFSLVTITSLNSINAVSQTNTEFIKTSCRATAYPSLCYTSLSNRASVIQASPKLLAQNALSVTFDTTKLTSAMMLRLSKTHILSPRDGGAIKDCIEVLSDSVDELRRSMDEMSQPGHKDFRLVMSDIETWVSAALTDENTCMEGFLAGKGSMKNVVRGKIVNVAHLTSNALALINSYASLHA